MKVNFKVWHLRLDDEKVPDDVTHVVVDDKVTTIKDELFNGCYDLVSVIMGDSVKRIEMYAFYQCTALRFVRLSKNLEYIGKGAFWGCNSLEALFLPSTVKSIEWGAFIGCRSLRLLILPNGINLYNVGDDIIGSPTAILQIAIAAGVDYYENNNGVTSVTEESHRRVTEWLIHHMDEVPFHQLCYDSFVTAKKINDYLTEHGNDAASQTDAIHGMTPLHMLSMNPNAPADAISALLNSNMEAVFCIDNQQKTALEYAREYNVGGLVAMMTDLCNHKESSIIPVEVEVQVASAPKRRRLAIERE